MSKWRSTLGCPEAVNRLMHGIRVDGDLRNDRAAGRARAKLMGSGVALPDTGYAVNGALLRIARIAANIALANFMAVSYPMSAISG